jgi:hypothetical protein
VVGNIGSELSDLQMVLDSLCRFSHDERKLNEEWRVKVPQPANEPVLTYAPGSPERSAIKSRLREFQATRIELPLVIDGREVRSGWFEEAIEPHNHR